MLTTNAAPKRFGRIFLSTTLLGLLAVCAAMSVSGCNKKKEPPAPAPPTVTVSLPLQKEVTDWDEFTGHLVSPETANVAPRVSGFIEEAPLKEGALVKKGDVLFVIDDRPFKADLESKKATVAKDQAQADLAATQLARYADLLKKRAVAQQDYDTNKAAYDQAVAQVDADRAAEETARLNLEWTRVTAPISGRVSKMYVTAGNLVNGGAGQATLLTTVVSVDPMYCYVPAPERRFLAYQAYASKEKGVALSEARLPCYVQLENETGFPHEGTIDFIDNSLDPNTGTIQLRGVIPNPTGALTPGLFAQMRINGNGQHRRLLVPDVAIGTEQNERFVMVVGAEDKVETRKIVPDGLFGSLRAITEGLKPDDRVIVNGLQLVRPGSQVTPQVVPIAPDVVQALEAASNGLAMARGAGVETPAEARP